MGRRKEKEKKVMNGVLDIRGNYGNGYSFAVVLREGSKNVVIGGKTGALRTSNSERKFSSTLHYPSTPRAWEPLLVKSPFFAVNRE